MPAAVVYQTRFNQPKTSLVMEPVAEGLRRVGYDVRIRESQEFPRGDEKKFDLACTWGDVHGSLGILAACGSIFRQVAHLDNSYLDRRRYEGHYGLSWGGQRQSHAYLWTVPRAPERFAALKETIQPWRTDSADIIILAPSEKQGRILGFDVHQWARRTCDQIQQYTKKRVMVRIKRYNIDDPLRVVLQKQPIFAAVGYNTKGLVECLLEGIPVFSLAPCVTEKMGLADLSQIEHPVYPDNRLEFFERLANTQFLLSEIAEGLPFQSL